MFVNRYLISVAIFTNILCKVTSLDFNCVSESYGILEGVQVLDVQVSTPPKEVNIPPVCHHVGVTAKVCSTNEENLKLVVPNLNKVLVSSDKPVTVNLQVYCNETPPTAQGQGEPKVTKGREEVALPQAKVQSVTPFKVKQAKVQKTVPVKVSKALHGVADVKDDADRAQKTVNGVKVGAAKAQLNAEKAQESVDEAQRFVAKAFVGGGKADFRVYRAEQSLEKAQRRFYRAQNRIHDAQKRANKAKHDVDKAQKRATKAHNRVRYVQDVSY